MSTLIIKLNASGDVLRTTPLLRRLEGDVTWVTARTNTVLIDPLPGVSRCLTWEDEEGRARALDRAYDLLVNLEDDEDVASFARRVRHRRRFGACIDDTGRMTYTDDSRCWFDLSLISAYGRACADHLKWLNRRSYQDLVFEGLGWTFSGEKYLLPEVPASELSGDVAMAPVAGPAWPMKGWAHYESLKRELQACGLVVNVLPRRNSLLQHIADVKSHRCLVSGDSLPMHIALGAGVRCVSIFNCTSPWEIHGYGHQTQLVSPMLEQFFYKRHLDARATTAIALEDVFQAVTAAVKAQSVAHP